MANGHFCVGGEYSDKPGFPRYDGHGIYLYRGCSRCEHEKRSGFRSDIDERYEADEPIDAED